VVDVGPVVAGEVGVLIHKTLQLDFMKLLIKHGSRLMIGDDDS
jgi:hypothetical protein